MKSFRLFQQIHPIHNHHITLKMQQPIFITPTTPLLKRLPRTRYSLSHNLSLMSF